MVDLAAALEMIAQAAQHKDMEKLAHLAGVFESLHTACAWAISRSLAGSVTPPEETGRLLTVNEAAAQTGLPAGFFYRNSARLPFTVRVSRGRLRFRESGLKEWAVSRTR